MADQRKAYYCYLMRCKNGAYYTGWTNNPIRRLKEHNAGRGARYTRLYSPISLVFFEEAANHSSALIREAQIKKLSHQDKEKLAADENKNLLRRFLPPNQSEFSHLPTYFTVVAPGRINLLGEHVDYNNGVVLPAAIDKQVCFDVRVLDRPLLRLLASDMNGEVEINLKKLEGKTDVKGKPLPPFALYPAGIAWALSAAGFKLKGLEVTYTSDIPIGAGLSSSAAVEVGFALAWQIAGGLPIGGMELVELCSLAENEYVGVKSGLMDQFASYFGQKGKVLSFDIQDKSWNRHKMPENCVMVIADSGIRRSLTESAYNLRHKECQEGLSILRRLFPNVQTFRDVSPEMLAEHQQNMPDLFYRRALHVVSEMERVRTGCECLEMGDAHHFGKLMFESHRSLKDLFEVSCDELDLLVEIASGIPGCLGARLTGAGFGGCTINLVEADLAPEFVNSLQNGFENLTGRKINIYLCHAALGAHRVA